MDSVKNMKNGSGATSFFYHKYMHTECVNIGFMRDDPEMLNKCRLVSILDGTTALIIIPPVFLGILGSLLVAISTIKLRLTYQQHLFSLFFSLHNIVLFLFIGIGINYCGKGLTWLGYQSFFFDTYGTIWCKSIGFMKKFIFTLLVNMLFAEISVRLLSMKKVNKVVFNKCQIIFIHMSVLSITFIQTSPYFILYDIWITNNLKYCELDPKWPRKIIIWAGVHSFLFCDGFLPCLLMLGFVVYLMMLRHQMSKVYHYIEEVCLQKEITSTMLNDTREIMNTITLNTGLIIPHISINCIMLMVRAVLELLVFKSLYINYKISGKERLIDIVLRTQLYSSYRDCWVNVFFIYNSLYFCSHFYNSKEFPRLIRRFIVVLACRSTTINRVLLNFGLQDGVIIDDNDKRYSIEDNDSVNEKVVFLQSILKANSKKSSENDTDIDNQEYKVRDDVVGVDLEDHVKPRQKSCLIKMPEETEKMCQNKQATEEPIHVKKRSTIKIMTGENGGRKSVKATIEASPSMALNSMSARLSSEKSSSSDSSTSSSSK